MLTLGIKLRIRGVCVCVCVRAHAQIASNFYPEHRTLSKGREARKVCDAFRDFPQT